MLPAPIQQDGEVAQTVLCVVVRSSVLFRNDGDICVLSQLKVRLLFNTQNRSLVLNAKKAPCIPDCRGTGSFLFLKMMGGDGFVSLLIFGIDFLGYFVRFCTNSKLFDQDSVSRLRT